MRAGKGLVQAGRQEHAAHEPLISAGTVADVPLAGLSFIRHLPEEGCILFLCLLVGTYFHHFGRRMG